MGQNSEVAVASTLVDHAQKSGKGIAAIHDSSPLLDTRKFTPGHTVVANSFLSRPLAQLWVILWGRDQQGATLWYSYTQPATTRNPLSFNRDAG
jgi:hypothetical protein